MYGLNIAPLGSTAINEWSAGSVSSFYSLPLAPYFVQSGRPSEVVVVVSASAIRSAVFDRVIHGGVAEKVGWRAFNVNNRAAVMFDSGGGVGLLTNVTPGHQCQRPSPIRLTIAAMTVPARYDYGGTNQARTA
jgi:hypothetical protein